MTRGVMMPQMSRSFSTQAVTLKGRLGQVIPHMRAELNEVKQKYGDKVLGHATVAQAIGGMRSLKCMICETSDLDAEEGIRLRGFTIPELQKKLPRAKNSEEPLPEALLWLLMTGEIPNQEQVHNLEEDLRRRAFLPKETIQLINTLPRDMHPMTQFCMGVLSLQPASEYARAYQENRINKTNGWETTLEDSLNLIAKLPQVAAMIYRNKYQNGALIQPDHNLDLGANLAHMLGVSNSPAFRDLMRLYLVIHSDHEGGNVSAHATHLVGSALSDPYLSYAAGMTGLAGPLHGLANQEVLRWILNFKQKLNKEKYSKEDLQKACWDTLNSGQVIPGYGHAVLRKTDPRYTAQREFALKHLPQDALFKLVSDLYEVVPAILMQQGKTKNPWPNVDAHSGVILHHYGLVEADFYTVLFAVSRALGVLSSLTVDRILGLPIERPKSITLKWIKHHFQNHHT